MVQGTGRGHEMRNILRWSLSEKAGPRGLGASLSCMYPSLPRGFHVTAETPPLSGAAVSPPLPPTCEEAHHSAVRLSPRPLPPTCEEVQHSEPPPPLNTKPTPNM